MTRLSRLSFLALIVSMPSANAQLPDVVRRGDYRHFPTRIELKLSESSGVVLRDGRLASRTGRNLGELTAALRGADVERLIPLPTELLDRWHEQSKRGAFGPDGAPGHLGLWFRVTANDANDAQLLIERLRDVALVETAYFEPMPETPQGKRKNNDLPPATPDYRSRQGYLGVPPAGINTAPARVVLGGRGQGVQVVDMEPYWNLDHEDICQLTTSAHIGTVRIGSGNHGTAVVGEYASDRNRYGTTGISDQVKVRVSSWHNGGVAAAISAGVNASKPGDIVLLEVHYRTSLGFVPAEYFASNYNVIKSATTRGVHITEAAGNGSNDLDDQSRFGRLFDLTFRDSGAIMCGASDGSRTVRAGFSNHGARITANGWGFRVVTCGYGGLFNPNQDKRQQYTSTFSGTSSASPIVTGAVASLVGAVKFQDDRVLSVNEVRQLLRKHGTPCTGKIQRRPDIAAMLKDVGLPDGLTARSEIVPIGTPVVLDVEDQNGRFLVLSLSDRIVRTDLGLNRKFHLDLARFIPLAGLTTTGSTQTVRVTVPNDRALVDLCLYFQWISTDARLSRLKVSSSTEIWVQ